MEGWGIPPQDVEGARTGKRSGPADGEKEVQFPETVQA